MPYPYVRINSNYVLDMQNDGVSKAYKSCKFCDHIRSNKCKKYPASDLKMQCIHYSNALYGLGLFK